MDDISARLARLSTPILSDAMDELGIAGVIVACPLQTSTARHAVGRALPVRFEPKEHDPEAYRFGGAVGRPLEAVLKAMQKDQIIVFDLGGSTTAACWGGLSSLLALRKGVKGVVIWGCCRDVDEIDALGFPVWSVGRSPQRSRNSFTFGTLGDPITVAGVAIRLDDTIVSDSNGVLVIPQERAEAVLQLAEAIDASEQRITAEMQKEEPDIDWEQV